LWLRLAYKFMYFGFLAPCDIQVLCKIICNGGYGFDIMELMNNCKQSSEANADATDYYLETTLH
jgi:hypothetical protein